MVSKPEKAVRSRLVGKSAEWSLQPGALIYSNSHYLLLGLVIESVRGIDWQDAFEVDLFAPLGLESPEFCRESNTPPGCSCACMTW